MNQFEIQGNEMCLLVTITMGQFSSVIRNHQIFIHPGNKYLFLVSSQLPNLEGSQDTL